MVFRKKIISKVQTSSSLSSGGEEQEGRKRKAHNFSLFSHSNKIKLYLDSQEIADDFVKNYFLKTQQYDIEAFRNERYNIALYRKNGQNILEEDNLIIALVKNIKDDQSLGFFRQYLEELIEYLSRDCNREQVIKSVVDLDQIIPLIIDNKDYGNQTMKILEGYFDGGFIENFVEKSIQGGNIKLLEEEGKSIKFSTDLLELAVKSGDKDMVEYVITNIAKEDDKPISWNVKYLEKAIESGNKDMVEYVINNIKEDDNQSISWDIGHLEKAVESDNKDIVEYVINNITNVNLTDDLLKKAIESNNPKIVKLLIKSDSVNKDQINWDSHISTAININIEILGYISDQKGYSEINNIITQNIGAVENDNKSKFMKSLLSFIHIQQDGNEVLSQSLKTILTHFNDQMGKVYDRSDKLLVKHNRRDKMGIVVNRDIFQYFHQNKDQANIKGNIIFSKSAVKFLKSSQSQSPSSSPKTSQNMLLLQEEGTEKGGEQSI